MAELVRLGSVYERQVERLQAERFPSETSLLLLEVVRGIVLRLVKDGSSLVAESKSDEQDLIRHLKTNIAGIYFLGDIFLAVEGATTKKTPWSLVEPLEKLGQRIHKDAKFLIVPTWGQFNYSIVDCLDSLKQRYALSDDDFKEILPQANLTLTALFIIRIPAAERLNGLLHVLIGHELGHPLEKSYFQYEVNSTFFIEEEVRIREEVTELISKFKNQPLSDLEQLRLQSDLLARVRKIRSDVLSELISDLVCVHLFGIAGVLAIERLGWIGPLDVISEERQRKNYPPARYRIRKAINEFEYQCPQILESLNLNEEIKKVVQIKLDEIREISIIQTDLQQIEVTTYARIAYRSVDRTWEHAKLWIVGQLESCGFVSGHTLQNFDGNLVLRLLDFIPPDISLDAEGVEKPADLFAILTAGWLAWLSRYQDGPNNLDDFPKYLSEVDSQFRLLLKAIEYSQLRVDWEIFKLANP